ncbi:hypothetical protein APH_1407 [Anaplasma phagocytophilum str. HZ]|uniref:Uncharacterized protein n=1 Tax=Anaplasma phagocytophilum (strain HZ) TaxID=212042 RepID=Q2GIA2_ANAPZ|nr:hypothetical protein APH_1407 [Anaplasma phagocytophilum str. HZ]
MNDIALHKDRNGKAILDVAVVLIRSDFCVNLM